MSKVSAFFVSGIVGLGVAGAPLMVVGSFIELFGLKGSWVEPLAVISVLGGMVAGAVVARVLQVRLSRPRLPSQG